MGAPSGGSLVGKQVAKLPVPEHNDRLPWPYYAVEPAARAMAVTAQRVQTITLGPLGATAPVVSAAPRPAPPMAIPTSAKRVAGPSNTSAPAASPAAPIALPAQVKAPAALAVPAQMAPRRTAGPMTASGASVPAASAPGAPMVSYPSSVGSHAAATWPSAPAPAPHTQQGNRSPAPVRGAAGGSLVAQRAGQRVKRLGTASLVLGLLGIVLPLVAGVPAIICGHLALRRADPVWTPERLKRRAQWGLALGYLTSLAWLSYILVIR